MTSINATAQAANQNTPQDAPQGTANGTNAAKEQTSPDTYADVCAIEEKDVDAPILLERPIGEVKEVTLEPGRNYIFGFEKATALSYTQNGDDLTITFDCGGALILHNYRAATSGSDAANFAFSDAIPQGVLANLVPITSAAEMTEEPQGDIRKGDESGDQQSQGEGGQNFAAIKPAAGESESSGQAANKAAEALANIEPAAGDEGGGTQNSGYGFNSSFNATPVGPLRAVGPIAPTALRYNAEFPTPDVFLEPDDQPEIGAAANALDETSLAPGGLAVNGVIPVDFGNDSPGTIAGNGIFSFSGSAAGGALSSGGAAVTVTQTATGYEGVAGGVTVFTLTIDPATGAYTYTQLAPFDHADGLDPNDAITLVFGITATDEDGDTATTTLTIAVADDAPQAVAPMSETIDESALSGGPVSISDTLVIDFGNDVPGVVNPNGSTSVSGDVNGGILTSGGVPVVIAQTANGYTGTAGGLPVFEITVNNTGGYTFTLFAPLDHSNPGDTITLDFGVDVTDFDGDSVDSTITINITDDVPHFGSNPGIGTGVEYVDETFLGPVLVGGNLVVNTGADVPVSVNANGDFNASGSVAGGALTSGGVAVTVVSTPVGYTGYAGGVPVFDLYVNSAGAYIFTQYGPLDHADGLDPNDDITLTFGVVVTDGDGDTDTGAITIHVLDDVPSISGDVRAVDESDLATATVNGSVAVDFGSDVPGAVTTSGNFNASGSIAGGVLTSGGVPVDLIVGPTAYVGVAGGVTVFALTIDSAGNYVFTQYAPLDHADTLNPDDVISLSFGVSAFDWDGDSSSNVITINVADDGPSIAAPVAVTIDESALGPVVINDALTVDFGTDQPGIVVANGVTSVTGDVNNGVLSSGGVAVDIVSGPSGYIGTAGGVTVFTLVIDYLTGAYTYTQFAPLDHSNPGDLITLSFGATVTDFDGDTASTNIVVNVKDDVPSFGSNPGIGSGHEVVDETGLGPVTVGGALVVHTGADVPTFVGATGAFTSTYALTSGGAAVTIYSDATGYQGITAGGVVVFVLTLNSAGAYEFTQYAPLDHADATNPNDAISLNFGVAVVDADGDAAFGSITVDVLDDGPVAVDDGNFTDGSTTISGNVVANDDVGSDVTGAVTEVTINGVTTAVVPGVFTVVAGLYGALFIDSDGNYFYGAFGGADGTDQFTYTLRDFDGDTATAKLTIDVNIDNVPVLVQPEAVTVDETNLGPVAVSDTVEANFFTDGPGTITGNGGFTGGPFTSGGHAVDVVFDAGTNTYTGTANGASVFTLVIQPDGNYTFTLLGVLDHPDATNPNDQLSMQFGVTATDADGDAAFGTITVNVLDDGPVAVNDGNFTDGGSTISGNVLANDDVGADVAGTVTDVTINGVTTAVVPGVFTVVAGLYGALFIDSDGNYFYGAFGGADGTDQFTYTLRDFDGDTSTANLTIGVDIDHVPVLVQPEIVTVDETALAPTTSVSDTVEANFFTDGPGTITGNGGFTGGPFTSGGHAVNVAFDAGTNTYTGTANGVSVFTLVLQSDGNYTFTLLGVLDHPDATDPNDQLSMQFGVTATDADGDAAFGSITVNVLDDGPVAVNDGNFTNVLTPITGNVLSNDDVGADAPGAVSIVTFNGVDHAVVSGTTTTVNGGFGALTIAADGSYSYTAFGGADGTDQFTYTMHDFDGDTSSAKLTIDVNVDDKPIVVQPPKEVVDETNLGPITETGTIAADFGTDGPGTITPDGTFVSSGSKLGGNLTSGGVAVVVTPTATGYVGTANGATIFTLTINPATGDYSFTLSGTLDHADGSNPNDFITLEFGVVATDADGDAASTVVTVRVVDDAPVAVNDSNSAGEGSAVTGNVLANDDAGSDGHGLVTQVQFNGATYVIPQGGNTVVNGDHGVLTLNSDGSYSYTATGAGTDQFIYTLKDFDGDTATAKLTIDAIGSKFIVGQNVNDVSGSPTPYTVGTGNGVITGLAGGDILVGDTGGSKIVPQINDFNVVLILDVSGSMAGAKLTLLKQAVNNLLADFHDYDTGSIKVDIIPFASTAQTAGAFTVTNDAGFANAVNFINALVADGFTNYEHPLQQAVSYLNSSAPIAGAETLTYFVSDGEPNRYVAGSSNEVTGTADQVMNQITGVTDGTNEVAQLQALSDEVIGVGIGVNATTLGRLGIIDSDGAALDVQNPSDLNSALQNTNPLNQLVDAGGDNIVGGDGNDIIFGDVLFTDALATANGLTTPKGAGWAVFESLEAGEGTDPTWDRADTLNYIRTHTTELGQETTSNTGDVRDGGNDHLFGGAGNDTIFGQEGHDIIAGGAGNDILSGGTGDDVFLFQAISDGVDAVTDFVAADDVLDVSGLLNGYDPVQDSINDFVFATESGGNTTILVDANGSGNIANATAIAVLQGVTGLNIEDITHNGQATV